jgi:hypothetical protein
LQRLIPVVVAISLAGAANLAAAAPVTAFKGFADGAADFASAIQGAGGTVSQDVWSDMFASAPGIPTLSRQGGAYTVSRLNGQNIFAVGAINLVDAAGNTGSVTTSGFLIDISVRQPNGLPLSSLSQTRSTGLRFQFANPTNGVGFEVADWATCCEPSALWVSIDNGTPIKIGEYTGGSKAPFFLTSGRAGVFVSIIDLSTPFTSLEFWGDGFSSSGEELFLGGQVLRATVPDIDPDPNNNPIPEPASLAMLGVGLLALALLRRRFDRA